MFRKLFQGFDPQNTHCKQLEIQNFELRLKATQTKSIRAMSHPNANETMMKTEAAMLQTSESARIMSHQ